MFKAWTDSADDPELLARSLEAHLNEFAAEVVAVSYDSGDKHRVLAVYRTIEPAVSDSAEAVLAEAESLLDEA